jgi:hypothetical protein
MINESIGMTGGEPMDQREVMVDEIIEPTNDEMRMREDTRFKEYRPRTTDALREYEVHIKFLSRGCIVSVGCREIAFENPADAMKELSEYVTNPYEVMQKWQKIFDKY